MESIYTFVYNLLTGDTALKTIMTNVIVKPAWQPPDTAKPYIVQFVDLRPTDAPFPLRNGTLQLHLWDDSPNASRILSMRGRIVILLENLHFTTANVNCRCKLGTEGFVPDEPGIWHLVLQFDLRLYQSSEAIAILARDGVE